MLPQYNCNHNFFSYDNEQSFYWSGFIAADGNVYKKRLSVTLNSQDHQHLIKLKENIQFTGPVKNGSKPEKRQNFIKNEYFYSRIRITSSQLIKDLLKFNIVENKSKIYKFPVNLLNNENVKHFIRGLIDGDGGIYFNKKPKVFFCGTENCVTTIFFFLKEKLQLESGFIKKYKHSDNLSYLSFEKNNDVNKILHYLYDNSTIFLDRKKQVADKILSRPSKKIDSNKIEELYKKYKDVNKVAEDMNISVVTIRKKFKINQKCKLLKIITKEQLLEDIKELKYTKDIAKKYNVNFVTVKSAIINIGLNPKDYNFHYLRKDITKEDLEKSLINNKSLTSIGKDLKLDKGTVKKYLIKYGLYNSSFSKKS